MCDPGFVGYLTKCERGYCDTYSQNKHTGSKEKLTWLVNRSYRLEMKYSEEPIH